MRKYVCYKESSSDGYFFDLLAVSTEKEERIVIEVQLSRKISIARIREALRQGIDRIEIVTPTRKLESFIRKFLKSKLMASQMRKINFKRLSNYLI